jgi:hypothetical protein
MMTKHFDNSEKRTLSPSVLRSWSLNRNRRNPVSFCHNQNRNWNRVKMARFRSSGNLFTFSICSLNLASMSLLSFLGMALSSSSTVLPQKVHLNSCEHKEVSPHTYISKYPPIPMEAVLSSALRIDINLLDPNPKTSIVEKRIRIRPPTCYRGNFYLFILERETSRSV